MIFPQQIRISNKGILSALLAVFLFGSSFISEAQVNKDALKPKVFHIQNYFSEVYLVKGASEKLILIETGVPVAGYQDSLIASIKKLGFKPENITLAIVTHGHGDHTGNARFLQQTFHIPIAGSKADVGKFASGKTELAKCEDVSIWGNRLPAYSDLSYQPFTPDVLVDQIPIDLSPYGVNGKIIPIPGGHTPGDLLVLIGENLFVGDAFVGTFKAQGGGLIPDGHHVREHFYHENKQRADQNLKTIEKIALDNHVAVLYPTHNGPVSTYELTKYIKEEPLLKLLSNQTTAILNDVVEGKSDLQNTVLADNFIMQKADGKEFTKSEFIEAYIKHPESKIESLSAEDFRIVCSTEYVIILTYIESIKFAGMDAKNVGVKETYSKIKGSWMLVYKVSVNQ